MPELKAFTEGYLKGYEDGLREAWEEFLSLTNKGYTNRELQIMAKGLRTNMTEKLERKRRKMMAEIEFAEPIEEVPRRPAPGTAPAPPPGQADYSQVGMHVINSMDLEMPMGMLGQAIASGCRALCIARTHPDAIRRRFGIDCQMVWLTKTESRPADGDQSTIEFVSPTELPRVNTMIKTFLSVNKGGIVLLEGMEYLIAQNEFKSVLRFLQGVRDQVILAKGRMLVPFDPTVLEERDLKALQREMT
jgi:hypothetical protein